MKRLLPLLLLLTLVGCDDGTVATTSTPAAPDSAAAQEPQAAKLVEPGRSCADFLFYKAGQSLPSTVSVDPIALSTGDESAIEIYDPTDVGLTGATSVRIKGRLNITTEEPHAKFEVSYISGSDTPIRLDTYAADGSVQQTQYLLADPAHVVLSQSIEEPGGTKALSLSDGGDAGALSRVCILQ